MTQQSTRERPLALTSRTATGGSARQSVKQWLREEVLDAPFLPVLHPSPLRMKGLGLFTLLGHPLYWLIWTKWLPQPYENLGLRIATGLLGLLLFSNWVSNDPSSKFAGYVFSAVFWLELPLLFSWMFYCNGGNAVWLASMAAMIFVYYFSTDWRLATIGIAVGMAVARILFELLGPPVASMSAGQTWAAAAVLAFCISLAMLLGASSANLRREHLSHTLATMGIMAHELRTPLATMALIGDALRHSAAEPSEAGAQRLQELAARLHGLVRNMNHQIDMQITNARLMRLPRHTELLSASSLVQEAVAEYPFRTSRERSSVVAQFDQDFFFDGSHVLFSQVLHNLMKNALRSLAAADAAPQQGDLLIQIGVSQRSGRITIRDRGIGIPLQLQPRIFEPFFSTDAGSGHGLGLAFCRNVVQQAGGSIRVDSEPGCGATFTIDLPIRS